nr:WYL domain-containing transcriptional regulator [Clostridia bacterium]
MARSSNQKLKLFHLLDILRSETDENHTLTTNELIEKLDARGISAERKALYTDIEALTDYGFTVEKIGRGYYLAERDYELAELKTLVDIIQSSSFLTAKKCASLTEKLYRQTSRYGAAELDRQIHTSSARTPNEKIFYTVDAIHRAIRDNKKISFSYFRYNQKKELVEKSKDKIYSVSPFSLLFDNENYYLVAFNEEENEVRHYRVDRMRSVKVSSEPKSEISKKHIPDMSRYDSKSFGMFGGNENLVTLNCKNGAAGAIIDRFSEEPTFICHNDGTFDVTVRVFVSPQFFGWLTGLGGLVKIKAPESIAEEYRNFLKNLIEE